MSAGIRGSPPPGSPPTLAPEDLHARVAAGEAAAMEELVAAHAGLVRVIAHRWATRLPPMLEQADLVQEGFLALLHCSAVFQPGLGTPFSSYAWRAVTRAVREARHRAERGMPRRWRPTVDRGESPDADEPTEGACEQAPTPAEITGRLAIRELVGRLPPSTRAILRLHFGFDGDPLSYREIARRLKQPPESVRWLAHRGLSTLAAALTEKEET